MKAWQLLEKEKSWTRGSVARDRHGHEVNVHDTLACRWCMFGAILRCYPENDDRYVAMVRIGLRLPNDIGAWNDAPGRKHSEVVAKLKEADV